MFNNLRKKLGSDDTHWLNYSWGFIEMVKGACYAIKSGHEIINDRQVIAIMFNIKHSMELFIKRSIVSLGIMITRKLQHHDLLKLFNRLSGEIDSEVIKETLESTYQLRHTLSSPEITNVEIAYDDSKRLVSNLRKFKRMVEKYYKLRFFRRHFGKGFVFTDYDNTAFKYPETRNNTKIDHDNFIGKITKKDLSDIEKDIDKLYNLYKEIGFCLRIYSRYKK